MRFPMSIIDLTSWQDNSRETYTDFILYNSANYANGNLPSIFSYFGHAIPVRMTEITYLSQRKKHLRCLVSFKHRYLDRQRRCIIERVVLTVPAWQGDNNFVHLMERLPGETERKINLFAVLQLQNTPTYLERMKQHYSNETLMQIEPAVFSVTDPVNQERIIMFLPESSNNRK